MKTKKLIALILIFIFIGVGFTFFFYSYLIIDLVRVVPMDIEFHPDAYGINGDTDALHFGRVALFTGAYITKFMKISNYEKHPSFVSISFDGEMADWTEVSENYFVLEPKEERELTFKVNVPQDAEPGNHTGTAKIVMKRYWH